ncbi:MAG: hypothetical protein PHV56_02910 [Clostridia bacterium]|nr:hypothetical protein [Clostridia bacterium]
MNWQTVYGSGKTTVIKNTSGGPASTATPKFLDKLLLQFVKQCDKYHKATDDIPFNYRELQLHSFMLPAMDRIADAVFVEQPINKNSSAGRLDYLVLSGNQVYMIELKHGWMAYKTNKVTGSVQSKWTDAVESLQKIDWKDAFELYPSIRTVAKITLMVTPTYEESKQLERIREKSYSLDTIYEKYDDFGKYLNPKPHWTGIWAVNQEISKVLPLSDGRNQRYPAVALLAHIDGQTRY